MCGLFNNPRSIPQTPWGTHVGIRIDFVADLVGVMTRVVCEPKEFENMDLGGAVPDAEVWHNAKTKAQAILDRKGGIMGKIPTICGESAVAHRCTEGPALIVGHLYAVWSLALECALAKNNNIEGGQSYQHMGRGQFLKIQERMVKPPKK